MVLYHALEDFTKLSQFIVEMLPRYRFHLGHYTADHTETVLFAAQQSDFLIVVSR